MKIKLILAAILLFLTCCSERELYGPNPDPSIGGSYTEIQGIVNGLLKKSDSPFYVSNNIKVEAGDTLYIEPGCELYFGTAVRLDVNGTLIASGNLQNRITFKPFDIDWQGIHIINTSTISKLSFCNIHDVYLPQDSTIRKGAVEFTNAGGEISNCRFDYNYVTFGGAIYSDSSSLIITNNIFYRNEATVFGGALYSYKSSNEIYNNTVYRNSCFNYGGGFVIHEAVSEDIQNNIFYNNFAYTGDTRIALIATDSANVNIEYNFLGYSQLNPVFISEDNLHLQISSPCIDAGNPDPAFNDSDGSRNDQGAYGGPGGDW